MIRFGSDTGRLLSVPSLRDGKTGKPVFTLMPVECAIPIRDHMRAGGLLCLLLLALLAGSPHVYADPAPFRAVYRADYRGLPVSAVGIRELRQLDENRYVLSSSARTFFASVIEQSVFTLDETQPIPIEYTYKRQGIGKNRTVILDFDREAGKVSDRRKDWELKTTQLTLDKLLYQLKMRFDLLLAHKTHQPWPEMTYHIADNGRMKTYRFRVTGEEDIETPIGRLRTIKAIRLRESSERTTAFWLAPDYEFLLVRLLQTEGNGKGFELLLKEAEFDGQPVQGM